MIADFVVLCLAFLLLGLAIYLMQKPIQRGLTFRGEPTMNQRFETKGKDRKKSSNPFKSLK